MPRRDRLRTPRRAWTIGGITGLVLLLVAGGLALPQLLAGAESGAATAQLPVPGREVALPTAAALPDGTTASALLAALPVKGKAPKTGYDREGMFGTAWLDVDRNGCDTRNDILARDLTGIVAPSGCRVTSGTLVSPYTGATVDFVRGNDTSALVQIDHVVALSNAWQTGAQQLGQDQRIALANDPLNLLAVDGRSNSQKSDGDSATWLPANSAIRCAYVARQISVKAAYGLWVTKAEADAMGRVLEACPAEPALASSLAPQPAPAEPPVPATPEPAAPEVVYANCDAVRAAGAAPIRAGTPGYSTRLDGDGDGVGCDN
jgi:hypothetical protein